MFRSNESNQVCAEFVSIEALVPEDHLLRKIDCCIDLGFIREKTKPLYCENNGRPCIDPVMLFKMIFVGYLFGIRSERRLIDEIKVNVAYRWFIGLKLTDPVPHHSTISQNRRRRFNGTDIFQEIFDEIVIRVTRHGMIEGKELFTDSTFLKASASRGKYTVQKVSRSTRRYIDELNKAVDEDRKEHGKRPLKEKDIAKEEKEARVSTTEPDAGYMVRDGKPEGFFYLDHRTVDGKFNMITDVYVTPGNVHDSIPYIDRLERQVTRFGFEVEQVALDAGYLTNPICHELKEKGIFAVIAHRRFHPKRGFFHKWQFFYDPLTDTYTCPAGGTLCYATTSRDGYRHYKSNPTICKGCPNLTKCTDAKNHTKVITRHVWEADKEWVRENRLSEKGKVLYKRRSITIERSFADAKELHGLRYARMRGVSKVKEQCLMIAIAQNIKKMALHLFNLGGGSRKTSLVTCLHSSLSLWFSPLSIKNKPYSQFNCRVCQRSRGVSAPFYYAIIRCRTRQN